MTPGGGLPAAVAMNSPCPAPLRVRQRFALRGLNQALVAGFAVLMLASAESGAIADEFTPDPAHWRPVHYFDLQFPAGEAEHFASLWADRLDANDKAYAAKGDRRFAIGHAPASEAHFSINFQTKFVVLSVLDTSTDCRPLREFRCRAPLSATLGHLAGPSSFDLGGDGLFPRTQSDQREPRSRLGGVLRLL